MRIKWTNQANVRCEFVILMVVHVTVKGFFTVHVMSEFLRFIIVQ